MTTVVLVIASRRLPDRCPCATSFGSLPPSLMCGSPCCWDWRPPPTSAGVRLAGWVQTVVTYTAPAPPGCRSSPCSTSAGVPAPRRPVWQGHLLGGPGGGLRPLPVRGVRVGHHHGGGGPHPPVITRALFIAPHALSVHAACSPWPGPPRAVRPPPRQRLPAVAAGQGGTRNRGRTVDAGADVTALNTFNGGFLVASRFIYAAAREGNLPRPFARLNLQAVPWLAVTSLALVSAAVAAVVFATGQWLLLVAVGTIEAGIYAIGSLCVVVLRRRETRARPFRLIAGKPLAMFGIVLFSVLFVATGFSDPKNARHLSVAPISVIVVLASLSTAYVLVVVPRLRAPPPPPGRRPLAPAAGRPGPPPRRRTRRGRAVPSSAVGRVPLKSDVGDLLPKSRPPRHGSLFPFGTGPSPGRKDNAITSASSSRRSAERTDLHAIAPPRSILAVVGSRQPVGGGSGNSATAWPTWRRSIIARSSFSSMSLRI